MADAHRAPATHPPTRDPDPAWNPEANSAIAQLLDHLAAALAQEYIRLMEAAARPGASPTDREPEV